MNFENLAQFEKPSQFENAANLSRRALLKTGGALVVPNRPPATPNGRATYQTSRQTSPAAEVVTRDGSDDGVEEYVSPPFGASGSSDPSAPADHAPGSATAVRGGCG